MVAPGTSHAIAESVTANAVTQVSTIITPNHNKECGLFLLNPKVCDDFGKCGGRNRRFDDIDVY